jgi:ATP-dependent helicase HepA
MSDTQSELGLGTVVRTDERCVHMLFPASGETRLYTLRNAPLTRCIFLPGDRVEDHRGRKLTVTGTHEQDGLIHYHCEDLDGTAHEISETELSDHLRLNRPREKLLAGRIDQDAWFRLRHQTWLRGAEEARSPTLGLAGARVSLVPHQLYIAAEVARRHAPRVLLADEVGLGKTIEAGLILHRMVLSERVRRVLILVPQTLLHQWLVEMLRRFNLRFALFDEERFDAADTGNPFHSEQRVLISLDLITSRPRIARALLDGDWDLLVVDEAHHLHWTEQESSLEYDLVNALAEQARGVLLLTGTPEQLGRAGHFGRLRLLDPNRFHDYHAFLEEERQYQAVASLAAKLLDGDPLGNDEQALLETLLGEAAQDDKEAVIGHLLDRHGTGRVLLRNTRAAIQGFPERRLIPHPLTMPDAYATLEADAPSRLTPESVYGPGWTGLDPRLPWLAATLRELRPEKVLVICAHADTVLELRKALLDREGIHAAVFHEGMEIVERDRAAAFFADPEEGSQALLCSEIGSEGRNFQFAHHLILFDLPLDPDLLEQRIGRLDRIGQTETIHIHVPYLRKGPGEALYRWYAEGLRIFEAPCPAATAVSEQLRRELLEALERPERTDTLVRQASALVEQLNGELERGRDRLLELHSHRPERSAALVRAIEEQDAARGVLDYMTRYWDLYGVEQEAGPGLTFVLHPGHHMLQERFPELPDDGTTVTFDRANALAHEDREFLTWEHPMVRGAMDLLTGSDLGSTAVTVVQESRFRPGILLLELIYVAQCPAPPELEVNRFLPPTAVRLLLDVKGRDHAARYAPELFQGECQSRNRKLTAAIIRSQGERLRKMFDQGEELARAAAQRLEADARVEMETELRAELARLRELAKINAGIRAEELEYLEARHELLDRYLSQTHMRLDAARIIVTS